MKKIIVLSSLIIVFILTYLFRYDLKESVKRRLKDEVTFKVENCISEEISMIIISESDTLFNEELKSAQIELTRLYGKNRFYLRSGNSLYFLDASYYKDDVWSRARININVTCANDSVRVFWNIDYKDTSKQGEETFLK